MPVNSGQQYEFGPFRLEPEEHLLLREGKPAPLTPKAFDLLVFLVRNQGRLVTKDQIMEALWAGSFVEESNITVLISGLRKVLGNSAAGEPYIQTVPKKGYRFTAPVKVDEQPEPIPEPEPPAEIASPAPPASAYPVHTPARWPFRTLAITLLISVLAVVSYLAFRNLHVQHSLAVLPLRNLRGDTDSDFLAFSLADAVITKLGVLRSVSVRPSSAVAKYQGREIDPASVGAELKADTLLTGNFIRDGDRLRITYQLIAVPANKIISKGTIDVKYDQLLAVHDNVSQQIVKGLQLNLSPSEAERIKPDQPVNPLAYEYYLRGVDLMHNHNFPLAVKMLEKSASIDSTYALTWAYLGQSYTSDASFELGGREQYRRAQAAYERALALQPKQLEAEMFLANLLVDTGKVEQAVPLLRGAIQSNPNDAALHWELGYAYRFAGMLNQSLAECLRARDLDPFVKSNGSVLNTYLYLGEYDSFIQTLPDVNTSGFFRFYRGFGEYH
ncbi:MAG: winged helix-turn-helix domain-containing protein, partial [Acidobacteriaceae bacterium]|nr:winged helix-turn-helix domain-containing protein [Acidobacteriaceae bacterium]